MKSRSATVIVSEPGAIRQAQSDLIMAWAQDAVSARAIYVLELDESRRGKKSGCKCIACGSPLTAVNAAATGEILIRPHFRHPEGTRKDRCLVLAARAALFNQLQEGGWIQLPSRRVSSSFKGLSGSIYEAWVETPRLRQRIQKMEYLDTAHAIITLDDGRSVKVELVGTQSHTEQEALADGVPIPTIYVESDDPAIAALSPEEIRERLRLLPDFLCWRHHWSDTDLEQQALNQAKRNALEALDAAPEGLELPDDMPSSLRRETVLHFTVKQVLAEAKRLMVPAACAARHVKDVRGQDVRKDCSRGPHLLELSDVVQEKRVGTQIPDLTCQAQRADGSWARPLLIEVTVTNRIDDVRLRRIQELGLDAIEINLGLAGGTVTRSSLRQLVVEEIANKRWLAHPEFDEACRPIFDAWERELVAKREAHLALLEKLNKAQAADQATPLHELLEAYRKAVIEHCGAEIHVGPVGRDSPAVRAALKAAEAKVGDCVAKLTQRGYPESGDEMLLGERSLLSRLYSIRYGRPIGYSLRSLYEVLNAIMQIKGRDATFHSAICIAYRAYVCPNPGEGPPMGFTEKQHESVEAWVRMIREDLALNKGKSSYARDPIFDRFLALLFPEMAEGLNSMAIKRSFDARWNPDLQQFQRRQLQPMTLRRAAFLLNFKPPVLQPDKESSGQHLWLQGKDLEEWALKNPAEADKWADAVLASTPKV